MISLKDIINRIKSETGNSQKHIALEIFGISSENLSNKIRRNSIDINGLVSWAVANNIDLNWLLTGKRVSFLKSDKIEELFPNKELGLYDGFIDKQRALDICLELMELEKLDRETFKRVESYIKGTLDTIREIRKVTPYNGPERRKGQRRIQDHPDQIPDGQDRRTGEDRRKVSGGSR